MEQLIYSLQDYFSCTISCFDALKPLPLSVQNSMNPNGDILPVYSADTTRILVPRNRLQETCAVLWEFSGRRELSTNELEHLLLCSRMIALKFAESLRVKELFFYRQAIHVMGKETAEGVILYDSDGNLMYQNSVARDMKLVNRFQSYMQQNEDKQVFSKQEHTIYLEGTAPLQLNIINISSGETYLGRVIQTKKVQGRDPAAVSLRSHKGGEFLHLLGKDDRILKTMRIARRAASTDATVLLRGESGTGKEQFARAIHEISERRNSPFVAINCAAIPENLLESELFGYEEGSFTGAAKGGKLGKIEAADTGTIFLDEIGDMPPHLQAKLLRVLQSREFERVGGTKSISVDVRFISATHRDLSGLMQEGTFRPDLYYRLNVIPIQIPALREHPDDIEIILTYYVKKYAIQSDLDFTYFSYEALQLLKAYPWPGNIRELENVVQYCMTMSGSKVIDVEDLPPGIAPDTQVSGEKLTEQRTGWSGGNAAPNNNKGIQPEQELEQLLRIYGTGTQAKKRIAEQLGISLATLYRRLQKRSK